MNLIRRLELALLCEMSMVVTQSGLNASVLYYYKY